MSLLIRKLKPWISPITVLDIKDKKALLALRSVVDSAIAIYDEATSPNTLVRLASIKKYHEVHDNIFIV